MCVKNSLIEAVAMRANNTEDAVCSFGVVHRKTTVFFFHKPLRYGWVLRERLLE